MDAHELNVDAHELNGRTCRSVAGSAHSGMIN